MNTTLSQSSIIALLVTNILKVVLKVLWIRNWWQLIYKVQSIQLSTKTVDFTKAALTVQDLRFFKKRIYVLCNKVMVDD